MDGLSGRGSVYSYTVVERTAPAYKAMVPYVVALIDLEEGPRMMSWVKADNPSTVKIGMAVMVAFARNEDGGALPVFEPVGS